jgi:hypothetical protein
MHLLRQNKSWQLHRHFSPPTKNGSAEIITTMPLTTPPKMSKMSSKKGKRRKNLWPGTHMHQTVTSARQGPQVVIIPETFVPPVF